ncbi:CD1375 family protein [Bacillota bacterium Meth-B3]
MIDLYVALIRAGKRTIESVPDRYRAEVEARLTEGD